MSNILVFPDRMLKHAIRTAERMKDAEICSKANRLIDAERWKEAIPFCMAAFARNSSDAFLRSLGTCCFQAAIQAAKGGTVNSDCEDYANTAINAFTFLIDANSEDYHDYAKRGEMYLLKAQFDGDRRLLANAEADFTKAIELGSPNDAALRSALGRVAYVRSRM